MRGIVWKLCRVCVALEGTPKHGETPAHANRCLRSGQLLCLKIAWAFDALEAEEQPQPRRKQTAIHWLDDIIIRAGLESSDLITSG
jgi:hypothetical protein